MIATIQNHDYRRDADGSVSVSLFTDAEAAIVLVSATVTLKRSGSVLLDAVAATTSGNTVTYTIDSSILNVYALNMILIIDYIYDTDKVDQAYFLINVMKHPLINSVLTAQLKELYPDLDEDRWTSQSNFQIQIHKAFLKTKAAVEARAVELKAGWYIDASQLDQLIENKAFMIIFRAWIKGPDDVFNKLHDEHKEEFADLITGLRFYFDKDDDGIIDGISRYSTRRMIQ